MHMHEYSVARALLRQVEEIRLAQQANRVQAIRICIGEFSGVEPELLQMAFDALAETAMSKTRLEMRRIALTVRCDVCGHEQSVEKFRFECSLCGSSSVTITGGEELTLESVTLEQADP